MTALTAKGSAWPVLLVTLALLAVLALAFWLVDPLRGVATAAFEGDGGLVRSRTHDLGAAGRSSCSRSCSPTRRSRTRRS
jgi:cyanate permease